MARNDAPLGLAWHCPACSRRGRAYELLCPTCLIPRPLLPDPLQALLPRPEWEKLLPGLEAAFQNAARLTPELAAGLEPHLLRLAPLAQTWGNQLTRLIEQPAANPDRFIATLTDLFERLAPLFAALAERWDALGPDPIRAEAQLRQFIAGVQDLLDRLDEVASRYQGIEDLRLWAGRVLETLLPLARRR